MKISLKKGIGGVADTTQDKQQLSPNNGTFHRLFPPGSFHATVHHLAVAILLILQTIKKGQSEPFDKKAKKGSGKALGT